MLLPPVLLTLLFSLPARSAASPSPPLVASDYAISLIPRHTLFLRQLSNLQTFDGQLGGVSASPITNSGDSKRPFSVEGDTFDQFDSAAQRSCDRQFSACQEKANGGGGGDNNKKQKDNDGNGNGNGGGNGKRQDGGLSVSDCDEQKNKCNTAQKSATVKDFTSAVASTNIGPDPDFPDFDLICEG